MSDFLMTYDVPGVPDLQVGVTDTGQVGIVIATEEATLHDAAQIAALQQVLEQARVEQANIYYERFPPELGIGDKVRFCEGNEAGTMLTGYVVREPWGSKTQNVTIRTDEKPSRQFVRLTANVRLVRKAS
jgi:hypothetical protein